MFLFSLQTSEKYVQVKTEITSLKTDLKSKQTQLAQSQPSPEVTAHKTLHVGATTKIPAADPVFRTRIGAAIHGVLCPNPIVLERRKAAVAEKFRYVVCILREMRRCEYFSTTTPHAS